MSKFYLPSPPFIPSLFFSPPLSLIYMVFKSLLHEVLTSQETFWQFGCFKSIPSLQQVSIGLYYFWFKNNSIPFLIITIRIVFMMNASNYTHVFVAKLAECFTLPPHPGLWGYWKLTSGFLCTFTVVSRVMLPWSTAELPRICIYVRAGILLSGLL